MRQQAINFCLIEDERLHIPCPHCGAIAMLTIGWIKANAIYRCGCGEKAYVDTERFERDFSHTEAILATLMARLKALP